MHRDYEIRHVLQQLLEGEITEDIAVASLLYEMGRGGRILVVDEHLLGLEQELSAMNYTTLTVARNVHDDVIKQSLNSKIVITKNGQDFEDDLVKYRYGLIWIVSKIDDHKLLANMVKDALMKANFSKNLTQIVKI
jgi:hypothetical protein